jgi:hypothetical protein
MLTECNFGDEHGDAVKPTILEDYNRDLEYADKSDRMANNYSVCHHTWKWTKKLSYLLDLTLL